MLETAGRTVRASTRRSPGTALGCWLPLAVALVLIVGGMILSFQGMLTGDQFGIAAFLGVVIPVLYLAVVWQKPIELLWSFATLVIILGIAIGTLLLTGLSLSSSLMWLIGAAVLIVLGGSTWLSARGFLNVFLTAIVLMGLCYGLCLVVFLLDQATINTQS